MFELIKPVPHQLFCLAKINGHADDLEKPYLPSEVKTENTPGGITYILNLLLVFRNE